MKVTTVRVALATLFGALAGIAGVCVCASELSQATIRSPSTEDGLIRDSVGRIEYIVELTRESPGAYANQLLRPARFPSFQKPEVVNAVEDIEDYYGFKSRSVTSLTIPTFTAFLDDRQLARLQRDPRIQEIHPNRRWSFSITAGADSGNVWTNRVGAEVVSWGKIAVNSSSTPSTGAALVYVVDAGVGQHEDLNVVERVNGNNPSMDCGSRIGIACTSAILPSVVGCYTHATAVAGVIGALANGKGTQGVNPGVRIVSVAASDAALVSGAKCLPIGATDASIANALEWIAHDLNVHRNDPVAVVNLSINPDSGTMAAPVTTISGANTTVDQMMYAIAHPTAGSGAIVIQSAGNNYQDACTFAYNPPNAASPGGFNNAALNSDGIMVVGAINARGEAVVPLVNDTGFWKQAAQFGWEKGSNFGNCVDTWAPGDGIYMPVANPSSWADQNSAKVYATYGMGSGTSFSAPHVAGLASVLIEQQSYGSAAVVEAAVRANAYPLGSVDNTAIPIKIPSLSQLTPNQAYKPYADLLVQVRSPIRLNTFTNDYINGYSVCSDDVNPCSFTGDPPTQIIAPYQMDIEFRANGGACTVTRINNLTTFIPIFTNKTSYSSTREYWNSDSGNPTTTWAISSTCLPNGISVVSGAGSMKVSPNPVVIPSGQSSGQYIISWNVTGYQSGGVSLYGMQNLGPIINGVNLKNQNVCLGNSTDTQGSVSASMVPGEVATLTLTSNSNCTAGSVYPSPSGNKVDSITVTTQ